MTKYHYTSLGNLFSIINNKSIWLIHCEYLNDPKEYQLGRDLFIDKSPHNMREYLKVMDQANNLKSGGYYVFCLSNNRDSLNQFRLYGDDGKGVCIGFDIDMIKNKLKQDNIYANSGDCHYDFNHLTNKMPNDFNLLDNVTTVRTFAKLQERFILSKHVAYKEESEHRLFIKKENTKETNYSQKFHYFNGLVKPYIEVKIDFNCICEIILGPKCDERNISSLDTFFWSNEYYTKPLSKSDLPYRD